MAKMQCSKTSKATGGAKAAARFPLPGKLFPEKLSFEKFLARTPCAIITGYAPIAKISNPSCRSKYPALPVFLKFLCHNSIVKRACALRLSHAIRRRLQKKSDEAAALP
jgi:hypothetical protein